MDNLCYDRKFSICSTDYYSLGMNLRNRIMKTRPSYQSLRILVCIIAWCCVWTTAQAQYNAQIVQDMSSTSAYIGSSDGYNADNATRVSGLNGSMASSWTPSSNGYMVTSVGAGYSEGIGYANGSIGCTKTGIRRVSPDGGIGEPGAVPAGDAPMWFILLLCLATIGVTTYKRFVKDTK